MSPVRKTNIKTAVFLSLFLAGNFLPLGAWKTPIILLGCAVMWIPDGRPRPRWRWYEIASFGALMAILLAVEFLPLSQPVQRSLMFAALAFLIVIVGAIWWDLLKLTWEIGAVLFGARAMIQKARAQELAAGRDISRTPSERGLRFQVVYWFLTAPAPWRRRD